MILLILLIGAILGWILFYISERCSYRYDGIILIFGVTLALVCTIIFFICSINIIITYSTLDGAIAEKEAQYNLLTFQVENRLYKDDVTNNALRELVVEIEKWNTQVVKTCALTHNFWIGIFYPDIYKNVNTIYIDNLLAP